MKKNTIGQKIIALLLSLIALLPLTCTFAFAEEAPEWLTYQEAYLLAEEVLGVSTFTVAFRTTPIILGEDTCWLQMEVSGGNWSSGGGLRNEDVRIPTEVNGQLYLRYERVMKFLLQCQQDWQSI